MSHNTALTQQQDGMYALPSFLKRLEEMAHRVESGISGNTERLCAKLCSTAAVRAAARNPEVNAKHNGIKEGDN
jgi:hypothetical protein